METTSIFIITKDTDEIKRPQSDGISNQGRLNRFIFVVYSQCAAKFAWRDSFNQIILAMR